LEKCCGFERTTFKNLNEKRIKNTKNISSEVSEIQFLESQEIEDKESFLNQISKYCQNDIVFDSESAKRATKEIINSERLTGIELETCILRKICGINWPMNPLEALYEQIGEPNIAEVKPVFLTNKMSAR